MICIGPVCIPIWHLFALLAFLFGPILSFIRGRQAVSGGGNSAALVTPRFMGPDKGSLRQQRVNEGRASPLAKAASAEELSDLLKRWAREHAFIGNDQDRYVLVKFGAKWCGPCKQISPVVEALRYCFKCGIVEVDVDEAEGWDTGVRGLPTFRLYKWREGEAFNSFDKLVLLREIVGAQRVDLETTMKRYCKTFEAAETETTD